MNSFSFYNPVKVLYGAGEVRRVGGEAVRGTGSAAPGWHSGDQVTSAGVR